MSSAFYQPNPSNINQDEAEAGSILVALANHHRKSMSIHSLLESNGPDSKKTAFTDNRAVSQGKLRESADEQYPATPPPTHYSYQPPKLRERMHSSPEVMQHQQNNAYVTHPPHMAKGRGDTVQHYQPHHLKHQQQHAYPSKDFSRQYTNMKQNPKIRRNALQAYISYMTYTDMTRKRMKQGPTMMHTKPNLPPASRYIAAPPSNYQQPLASPPYPHQQRRYHPLHHPYQQKPTKRYLQAPLSPPSPKSTKLIVEKPLTAFLHHQRGPPPPPPPSSHHHQHAVVVPRR